MKKSKVKGIAVEDRAYDYSIKIGKENPIYQFSTNKYSNFVNNFKYLKGYCDKGLVWKVHIVNENYYENMTMDNYQNMISRVQAN